jgi:acyl-coenzyme A thioesterase PaaI-like protein
VKKEERIEIPKPEGHDCFACGTANPIGLKLHFYRRDGAICTDITLGKYYVGWQNMAHGGIISTILDEVMSWTLIYHKRSFFVTRKMGLKFIKPVMVGVPLTAKGRLREEENGRTVKIIAELFDDEGKILARSTGEFVLLSKERMALVPEDAKNEMAEIFARLESVE